MVDTGGDAGLKRSRGRVRRKLKKYIELPGNGGGGGGGGGGRGGGGGDGGGGIGDPFTTILDSLDDVGVYAEVFTAPELIYYLQKMARLIQKSASGPEEAAEEFGVRPDSAFSALQRKIRLGAPGNSASDAEGSNHHIRALRAFQAGSSKWAKELTKAADLTVVTVKHVVMAVARNIDKALLSSPRAILEDYVDQVVAPFISDDADLSRLSDQLRQKAKPRLDAFFKRFDKPAQWVESRIPSTMKAFPEVLRG